jgi:UDP-2,3-diacylglucosamine hydrolase
MMNLIEGKKIYFISDLHLGTPDAASSSMREKNFVQWISAASKDAAEIFIVGDLFDFWHEYKTVVPKGFVRAQAAIANAADKGIKISLFTGNHDMWQKNYFADELGVELFFEPVHRNWNDKTFFIGHGDGLGPGDHGYKFLKKVFSNPICQFLFRWIHPDIGMKIANYFSYKSRFANGSIPAEKFLGEEREWLIQYIKNDILPSQYFDYFVFGHRHLPIEHKIDNSIYINLGDWISYFSYAVFDGTKLELKYFKEDLEQ